NYTLSFKGEYTRSLNAQSSPEFIQQALNELSTIGGVGGFVTVTRDPSDPTTRFFVTFGRSLRGSNQELLVGSSGVTVTADTDGAGAKGGVLQLANDADTANYTYRGTTLVQQGTLTLLHSEALGDVGISEIQTVTAPLSAGVLPFRLTFGTGPGSTTS